MRRRLPHSRVVVSDLMRLQRSFPLVTQGRPFQLDTVDRLRRSAIPRISWCSLFVKAYAGVALRHPPLRQVYLAWPWPHLYEHPGSVASVAIARRAGEEDWLVFGTFDQPEKRPLEELQAELNRYQTAPLEDAFAGQLRLSRLPGPVRRVWWWTRLNLLLKKRAKRLGTFGVTTLAGKGTTIVSPRVPLTSILSYGPLDPGGRSLVSITYDHRLLDGSRVADVLDQLEAALQGPLASELAVHAG